MKHYDVIVIGGGHAGTEAAAAAARRGAATALVTMSKHAIGAMSCNPAMGGLGKGHLVREIDALDGIMGRAADAAGIQFRLLNRSKGPAVQGPRAQIDRVLYRRFVQADLARHNSLEIIEAEVAAIRFEGADVTGVRLADGGSLSCRAVVLTAGTFLNGMMHIGSSRQSGGRVGDPASVTLAGQLADIAVGRGRLKTGTPPRLDGDTIDWTRINRQAGDERPVMLSFLTKGPVVDQVSCGVTATNAQTHDVVRENIGSSAMYGGHIEGVGPRYCPSIEDKVTRFADRESHQVYLEPEGLTTTTVYPNGISTSLPAEVQEAYVRTIVGLEQVKILQPGYAIEYDFFDPRGLSDTLSVRSTNGLFFAGQINGTTGYEEAAAQGVVAGLNAAALACQLPEAKFSRAQSYIGVLIDDLVTRGVTEPYRMFTSRAEFRLTLRADNADQRLTPLGHELGCVGDARWKAFCAKRDKIETGRHILSAAAFLPTQLAKVGIQVSLDGQRRSAFDLLGLASIDSDLVTDLCPEFTALPEDIRAQVAVEALYAPYADRQAADIAALHRDESQIIPPDFDYMALPSLSNELRTKLSRARPGNLGQAARLEGMTPSALLLLLANLRTRPLDRVVR